MKYLLLLLPLPLFFLSCTRSQQEAQVQTIAAVAPADVVRNFLELSSATKTAEDKRRLQDLCAGAMRRAFERMSDEEFRLSYLNTNLKIEKVQILESLIQNDSAKVRYSISIENKQGTDITHEVNEREVELAKSQGSWYIEFVRLKGSDKMAFTRGMIF